MTTKNEIIRKVNEAFSANDVDAFLSYCTEEITWDMISDMTTTGKADIKKMMTEMPGEAPEIIISDIFSEEDKGVCTGTFTMTNKEGEKENNYFCDVYHFAGDKIKKMDSYVVKMKK